MCAASNYDKVFEISKFAKLKDLYFKIPLCGSCIAILCVTVYMFTLYVLYVYM